MLSLCGSVCRSGLQQRRNSFEDGVAGTTCPIPPGANFTYILQAKEGLQMDPSITYPAGIVFGAACLFLFLKKTVFKKDAERECNGTMESTLN